MSSPSGASDPTAVLHQVLSRIVEKAAADITERVGAQLNDMQTNMIAQYHELGVLVGTNRALLNDLAKSLGGEKRKPKLVEPVEAQPAAEETPAEAPAEVAAVPEVKKAPRVNKMTWTRTNYQKDAAFRTWILAEVAKINKAFVDGLPNNPTFGKKTGAAKASAEATLVWKLIGTKGAVAYAPLMKAIDEKFAADKNAVAEVKTEVSGEQQVADANTDDETVA